MKLKLFGALGLVLALATPAAAVPFNVALGAPVTATATVGTPAAGWENFPVAALSTITDGAFVADGTHWQLGTVWWDERNPESANNVIQIELGGTYLISQLIIQADNNDEYNIFYRDFGGNWINCCFAVARNDFFGMWTRSGGPTFGATAIRIDARLGDLWYSISEFQAIGEAVPEPASLLLLGSGLTALVARRRRARKNQS